MTTQPETLMTEEDYANTVNTLISQLTITNGNLLVTSVKLARIQGELNAVTTERDAALAELAALKEAKPKAKKAN